MQNNKNSKYNRIKKLGIGIAAVIVLGFVYVLIVNVVGIGIPCPFHFITGLKCPGCGITTMFVAIWNLNFYEAFIANPLTFVLLPVWFIFIIYLSVIYINKGGLSLPTYVNYCVVVLGAIYIIFGILRNMPFWL